MFFFYFARSKFEKMDLAYVYPSMCVYAVCKYFFATQESSIVMDSNVM